MDLTRTRTGELCQGSESSGKDRGRQEPNKTERANHGWVIARRSGSWNMVEGAICVTITGNRDLGTWSRVPFCATIIGSRKRAEAEKNKKNANGLSMPM